MKSCTSGTNFIRLLSYLMKLFLNLKSKIVVKIYVHTSPVISCRIMHIYVILSPTMYNLKYAHKVTKEYVGRYEVHIKVKSV